MAEMDSSGGPALEAESSVPKASHLERTNEQVRWKVQISYKTGSTGSDLERTIRQSARQESGGRDPRDVQVQARSSVGHSSM